MNSFKESYQDDLENAFFDEDEFASRHTIDGKECTVILIDNTSTARALLKNALNPKEAAVNKISSILYIRDMDAEKLKRTKFTSNSVINLDGKKYFVQNVSHTDGVYRLTIGIHAV